MTHANLSGKCTLQVPHATKTLLVADDQHRLHALLHDELLPDAVEDQSTSSYAAVLQFMTGGWYTSLLSPPDGW